jgi:cell division protein FtsA
MFTNYICALDIGSSKIACVVAEIKRGAITNIFFDIAPSKGIKRGEIVNSIDFIGSIGGLLKKLKANTGIKIKFIYTNLSGQDIVTKHSNAVVPLAERGNKIITASDIQQINEQARILGLRLDEEIIHQIPSCYGIDSRRNILNPLGLYSHRLEVDLYLICGKIASIQSLVHTVNQAGYEIKDLFFSGIATCNSVFNKELKEGLNIICDIGSDITELSVSDNGLLKDIKILFIGGDDLTLQLQEALGIPLDLAEDIKKSYGVIGDYSLPGLDKEILLKKDDIYKSINIRVIQEIMTSKAELICQKIKDAICQAVPSGKVNNFIITGRTVLSEGFLELLENSLGISVKLGRINNPDIISLVSKSDILSGTKYLTYITALGILCEAMQNQRSKSVFGISISPVRNPILKTINKIKEVYQEYF